MNSIETEKTQMQDEYDFDYSQAKTNRFAQKSATITVTLDADIAKVFTNSKAVNNILRAILTTMPQKQSS